MFFNDDGTTIGMEENLKYRAAKELGYRAFLHACYSGLNIFEPTLLSEKVCEFSQTSTIEEAFKKIEYGKDLNILLYQDFVPYIYDAVLQKDRVAEDFINQVGIGFADCILDGIKYLGWETREIAFVLNGGSFKGKGYVLDKVIKNYFKSHPNIKLFQSKYEPVYGALMMSFEIHNNGVFPHISDEDALKFNLQRVLSVN
jgi:hypothetical protein